ncbi:MAG TPA: NAD/NADP octopine/nopaline dehydrogenase family protein [Clostridia bacterium]|nr:NAD/NADP octopine/nopaline dehydrogenase family protein [Clostridia bacterium]
MKKPVWAVIGGGNGGQAMAAHLGTMGFQVRIYDVKEENVEVINKQGGIQFEDGVVEGFGKVEFATMDMGKAVVGADMVVIVAPALYHKDIATKMAPHLVDGQIVFIHPGATCGSLEVRKVLDDEGCRADIVVGEAMSLLYAARSPRFGVASILGIKEELMVAAMPSNKTKEMLEILNLAFPQMYAGENVLETSFENLNCMVHPGPSLLNVAQIESGRDWKYYYDGITPSIGAYVEKMDAARVELGKKYNLKLTNILDWYVKLYSAKGDTLTEAVRNTKAYADISGQKTLRTRYILEDVPMSLVPLAELGKVAGIRQDMVETMIDLGEFLMGEEFRKNGRNAAALGIEGMNVEDLLQYVTTGKKK